MESDSDQEVQQIKPINYGESNYWDGRYHERKGERFQWLQSYARLKPQLDHCLIKGKESRILNLGCGNSNLQDELYQDGYRWIVSNDISEVVIDQMRLVAKSKGYTELQYDVMDVREMTYPSESFDLVIDKSTIDSLMCSDNPLINVSRMIGEGYRVLREGGYYFTVSYSGSRMEHFTRQNVKFDVKKMELKRLDNQGLQVTNYLYVCKKLPMPSLSSEERDEFYRKLKQIEQIEYP